MTVTLVGDRAEGCGGEPQVGQLRVDVRSARAVGRERDGRRPVGRSHDDTPAAARRSRAAMTMPLRTSSQVVGTGSSG